MKQPLSPDQPYTILIATSSAFDLAALQELLARYSFQVRPVSKGDEALAAAVSGGIALVLLDVTLAGSASFELCQRLSRIGGGLPVFLLSAAPDADEQQRAVAAGAAAYLPLPLQVTDVAKRILLELGVVSPTPAHVGAPQFATLEVNYHTMLAASPDTVLLLDQDNNRILDVNRSACRLFGLSEDELLRTTLLTLCPARQPNGRGSAETLAGQMAQVLAGDVRVFELSFQHQSGRQVACEMRMVALNTPTHRLMHMRIVDISRQKQAEALRDGKNDLLEMIAGGAPLRPTLDKLMLLIESQTEDVICTVLLLDPDGCTMHIGAGPSMPADYMAAIEGLPIGPGVGSCGTAMFSKATVVVSDIMADPLWEPYRDVAARYGLRACWATPVLLDQDTVLGSFAMYYRDVRSPTAEDRHLISTATHLAGIAIARTRREEELRRHREHLEELVSARTAALRRANEEAEHANEELSTALENLSMTQDELVRRDKLAALGALVTGVAHELNTPIGNSLMMASSMVERTAELRRDLEGGLRRSALEKYLQQSADADEVVVRNLKRAAGLVSSFKRIAVDAASSQRRRFQLDELVAELLLPLHASVKNTGLTVLREVDAGLEMDSYPEPLAQALGNLFENSMVHGFGGRQGGTITVRGHATADGQIALSLADDGAGIPAANLARVFDPFFTTRLGSGGSGLGLYITHNIVTGVLGGSIEASSDEGHGATFRMLLPPVAPL